MFIDIEFRLWPAVLPSILRNKHHLLLPTGQDLYVHQQNIVQGKLEDSANPNHRETRLKLHKKKMLEIFKFS